MNTIINDRLQRLRYLMTAAQVQAVIVPQADPHQSEYVADHWQVRRYLTGFTGSAGTLVVTLTEAHLWTDSRYFLQAEDQLRGSEVTLMKEGVPGTPEIAPWLVANLKKGATVGINGLLFSIAATDSLRSQLSKAGIKLVTDFDPIDELWAERPPLPDAQVFIHDKKYAGMLPAAKIKVILDNSREQGANAVFISALDEIAWALNLRSTDIDFSPVAMAFLYLDNEYSTLFINQDKLSASVLEHLIEANVGTKPYDAVAEFLSNLPAGDRVLLSATQNSGRWQEILGDRALIGTSPVALPKAVKNPVQIQGEKDAMVRDGVAMVRSIMEIEQRIAQGVKTTEIDVADILLKNRKAQDKFVDLSFATIAGWGPDGAIVHYTASKDHNAVIEGNNLLLIDSGGNYLDGTTDITRTIAVGTPTEGMIHDFTLVMKGHIAIATAEFPEGTRGAQLDVLARLPLWKEGKSYLHGTGHGVGHFLNVHEGPQSIRLNDTMAPLTPGMITSNEPGFYYANNYGIRCENLILTVEGQTTDFGNFYKFETLTLCPFDRTLFDVDMMTDEEIDWVDQYHARVCETLLPHLNPDEQQWLKEKTKSLLVLN